MLTNKHSPLVTRNRKKILHSYCRLKRKNDFFFISNLYQNPYLESQLIILIKQSGFRMSNVQETTGFWGESHHHFPHFGVRKFDKLASLLLLLDGG